MGAAPPHPPATARSHRGPAVGGLISTGLLMALPMFALFAAYAFLSEATYETSAKLAIDPVDGAAGKGPAPLALIRELQDAALDEQTLERLASETSGDDPSSRDEAAHRVRKAFAIDTKDGRTFTVTFRDSIPRRTQAVCNLLASRALLQVTRPVRSEQSEPSPRARSMAELLAFLEKHPGVALAGAAPGKPEEDPVVKALLSERLQIENALFRLTRTPASDNPYVVRGGATDRERLTARLGAIDAALSRRRKVAEQRHVEKPKLDAAAEAEWLRLLRAIQQAPEAKALPEPKPRFTARLTAAPLPASPIEPDRPRVLLIGALVGLVAGIVAVLGRARVAPGRARRRSGETNRGEQGRGSPTAIAAVSTAAATPSANRSGGTSTDVPPIPDAGDGPPSGTLPLVLPPPGLIAELRSRTASAEERRIEAARQAPDEASFQKEARSAITLADATPGDMKQPLRKVTQILGSPPSVSGTKPGGRVIDGSLETPPNTAYSYVNASAEVITSPPATARFGGNPGGARPAPDPAPARHSAPPPAAQGSAQAQPAAANRAPARVVLVERPVYGWSPNRALDAVRYQELGAALRQHRGSCLVLTVTGPPLEMRGRVATELAMNVALERRVLLVDADFQLPSVHQALALEMSLSSGYSHQLRARVQGIVRDDPWKVLEITPSLHVLAEGILRSPGMILSREFEDSIAALRTQYDFLIVNGPSLSSEVDLRALLALSDGVLLAGLRHNADVPDLVRDKHILGTVER